MEKLDVSRTDAQEIAELALSLKNMSYLLSSMGAAEGRLNVDDLPQALFALHRQVDAMSARLLQLNDRCRVCIDGSARSAVTPACLALRQDRTAAQRDPGRAAR